MAAEDTQSTVIWTLPATRPGGRVRLAVGFVALSYAVGAPVAVLMEYRYGMVSGGLGLPGQVVLLAAAVQLCCSVAILFRVTANLATAALTVISIAVAVSYIRGGATLASVPALAYSVVQVWLGLRLCSECAAA